MSIIMFAWLSRQLLPQNGEMYYNKDMLPFLMGACGFFSLLIYDISQIRQNYKLASVFSIIGYISILAAIFFLIFSSPVTAASPWLIVAGIGLSLVFTSLLIYSLFIELSYKSGIVPQEERCVVCKGTYKLVRHPAFLWFAALILSLNILFMSHAFSIVSMSLVLMDFLLVLVEDKYIFPALFADYDEYKKGVEEDE